MWSILNILWKTLTFYLINVSRLSRFGVPRQLFIFFFYFSSAAGLSRVVCVITRNYVGDQIRYFARYWPCQQVRTVLEKPWTWRFEILKMNWHGLQIFILILRHRLRKRYSLAFIAVCQHHALTKRRSRSGARVPGQPASRHKGEGYREVLRQVRASLQHLHQEREIRILREYSINIVYTRWGWWSWTGLGWLGFEMFHCLPNSAWASENLAELARQPGKTELPNQSQLNPSPRPPAPPCRLSYWIYLDQYTHYGL